MCYWNWKRYGRPVLKCNALSSCVDDRNKILVQAVEVTRGTHLTAQKEAVQGMDVWKRMTVDPVEEEQVEEISDEEMDIDG